MERIRSIERSNAYVAHTSHSANGIRQIGDFVGEIRLKYTVYVPVRDFILKKWSYSPMYFC